MQLAVILAVSHDSVVLATRTAVLRTAGYHVDTVESIPEAISRFNNGDFDLVLLCHSIPPADRDRLSRAIRATGSRTPILLVSPFSDARGLADSVINNHPEKLLEGVEAALQQAVAIYRGNHTEVRDPLPERIPRPTVLCIDHDPHALEYRRMVLEKSGYNVLTSFSFSDGLKIFSTGLPDAVILDYAVSEMKDGAAISQMRRIRSDAPLILYSGCSNVPEDVIALFDRFIPKGASPFVLLSALGEFLSAVDRNKAPERSASVTRINSLQRKSG